MSGTTPSNAHRGHAGSLSTAVGPFAAVLQGLPLGHTAPPARKCKETGWAKKTCLQAKLGKFWTKDTKRPKNPDCHFEEPGAKAGFCACPLHTHLLSHLPSIPDNTPAATPRKE